MSINEQIEQLRNNTLSLLADSNEFEAFTVLAYNFAKRHTTTLSDKLHFRVPYSDHVPSTILQDTELTPKDLPAKFQRCKETFLFHLTFQHQISLLEFFIFDALKIIYNAFPLHLSSNKKIEYKVVLESSSRDEIIRDIIERELNELKYQAISFWFDRFEELLHGMPISKEIIAQLAEA